MKFQYVAEYRGGLIRSHLCRLMGVSERGLRAWKHPLPGNGLLANRERGPPSHRQRRDMVLLAHIRDQHRLSLGRYGRPRMTEELNELGLRVGQPWPGNSLHANRERGRVGRVRQENDPPDRFQNLSHCARTAFKLFERGSSSERPTATTSSTSRRICCSRTSLRAGQTRNALSWFASKPFPGNRRVTSPMFGLGKAGCILL